MERVLIADIGSHVDRDVEDPGLALQPPLQGEARLPPAARRLGPDPGRGRGERGRPGVRGGHPSSQDGGLGRGAGPGAARRAGAHGLRADGGGRGRGAEPRPGLPDRQEGARHRLPAREPAPLAALLPAARHDAHPRHRDHGLPALLPRRGVPPHRHPDPHRLHRRERGHPVRGPLLRPRHRVPRADRPAVPRGGLRGLRQGLQLRADLPGREVQDAPAPDRVLDARGRGGVRGQRGQHAPAGAHGERAWSPRSSQITATTSRCSSATRPRSRR